MEKSGRLQVIHPMDRDEGKGSDRLAFNARGTGIATLQALVCAMTVAGGSLQVKTQR